MIKLFYSPHALSWAHMGSESGAAHLDHEHAMAAGHYMLAGDFFENHEKYHQFFDLIEDRKGFARYKKMVVDRADFKANKCSADFDAVFAEMLAWDRRRHGVTGT